MAEEVTNTKAKPLLVVSYPGVVGKAHLENLADRIKEELPDYKVIIVDGGASASVFPASFANVA